MLIRQVQGQQNMGEIVEKPGKGMKKEGWKKESKTKSEKGKEVNIEKELEIIKRKTRNSRLKVSRT